MVASKPGLMRSIIRWRNISRGLFALALLSCAGCDQLFQNRSARSLARADKKATEGNYAEAVPLYEAALDGTAKTADVHYQLALMYDDKLHQPAGALHHFQRYLELAPTGSHVRDVRDFIKQDEFKLANSLADGGTRLSQADSARLKNENLALRKQVTELRAVPSPTVAAASFKGVTTAKGVSTQKPIPPGARTYVVQPHDTLAAISRRFYKTPTRWKKIQQANFTDANVNLKPGETLVIP